LTGRAGAGKSTVARLAAEELVRRGLAEQVVEIHGAAVAAGAIFWPERDERLRQALEALCQATGAVAIFEEFDLVLVRSEAAAPLVADALDRGLKLIAVARPEFRPQVLKGQSPLRRRLDVVPIAPPEPDELVPILRRRLAVHGLAGQVELAPTVLPLVADLSARRSGANPGAAIGLLEAAINRAAFEGRRCIGPDDIYHLVASKTQC
jgi:ATP-dependent Clp protease ATP-binding subunit ClpA